ncbi:MAG: TIGR00159 family protein [Anaerolineae bacterium]|nr:TIGR00159 family protein [Anaerolineae bacterium]
MGLQEILWTLQNFPQNWQNFLDVFLVGSIVFLILKLVRGTRAATLLRGIIIFLIGIWALSGVLNLQAFSWLLRNTLTALIIAVPVIFQDDLRRWLDQLGRIGLLGGASSLSEANRNVLVQEIADAARSLSRQRHGALMVIERDTGLQEYIDSGVRMDSIVTSALLQTSFFPNTPLHDGAIIIRGERIVAGACTLPVSGARRLPDRSMGLRHRSALGLSEVSDAVVVVVSEETGRISVVEGRRFIRGVDYERLVLILSEYIKPPQRSGMTALLSGIQRTLRRIGLLDSVI